MKLEKSLSLIALSIVAALPVYADESNTETIVVTGQRFESAADQELMLIQTIEREDIEVLAPKSVQEILETLPGVSVTSRGTAANDASVSIRGGNGSHVMVLVDGVRVSSATLGSAAWGTLAPEQIERIEVLKGPRTSVWGSDAISGVIQIFTRKLEAGQWYASAEYGSNRYIRGSAGVGIEHGDGATTVTFNREESDGHDALLTYEPDDDAYERLSFGVAGGQKLNDSLSLEWKGEINQGEYDYDPQYGPPGANEAEYDNYLAVLGVNYQVGTLANKLSVSTMRDRTENSMADSSDFDSLFETKRTAINLSSHYMLDNLTFIAGADLVDEEVDSIGGYSEDSRTNTGVYGLARYQSNGASLEGAIRYDDIENIDSETTYNLSAGYRFNDTLRLSANVGTGFRAPTFNDLYWPTGGNPDLAPENSTSYDLTLSYSGGNADAYISVYKNDIEKMIAWAPTASGMWLPQNVNEAKLEGVEFGIDVILFGLNHHVGYNYLDGEDEATGNELVGRSEHEFDYGIGYQWEQFDVRVDYHHQSKRYSGSDWATGSSIYLDSYNKLDVSIGYLLGNNWQLRLKANNLMDEGEDMTSVNNYNGPEQEFFFSVSYNVF